MFDNIVFSANAVIPLVILIILGFCLKQEKLKLFKNPKEFFNQIDRLVFHVALPIYIFNDLANMRTENIFDIKLVLYCVFGTLFLVLLLSLTTPFFIKKKISRGAFIQGVSRANFAILGVPLAHNLFGEVGSATAALVLPFTIPVFNILAVIVLAVNTDDDMGNQNNARKIFFGIIKNPLIIAIILALPFMIFKISLPAVMQKSLTYLGNMSTPLALMSLGAGVELSVLKSKAKLAIVASIMKTVVSPVILVIPAVLLGFRDAALVAIFILFAAPTAVSSYIMAKNMKSDYELAGQITALSTVICPVTIFFGSLILKSMGFI